MLYNSSPAFWFGELRRMVVIARGFGFSMVVGATAFDGDDVSRKGDTIAVLMAVRRLIKCLDGRDKPHASLLLGKMIHTIQNIKPRRSLVHSPYRLILCRSASQC
mmetsp:Transcript_10872/g.21629  ORF Transcript_10872/g.21629 Transcript_10872/m.21629 type:complete len:105 (+) Transcript_10872:736-1050(+)